MDSGQRNKFIQQLLKLASDPERKRLARDVFGDKSFSLSSASISLPENKLWKFWGSTPIWGGIGVLAGYLASQVSLKLLFLAVWGLFVFEFLRIGVFSGKGAKAAGNLGVAVVFAALFFGLYKVSPKPKEPLTLDQEMTALAQRFPGLASPPSQETKIITLSNPRHSQVEYLPVAYAASTIGLPDWLPLQAGAKISIPIAFKNAGDFAVADTSSAHSIDLLSSEDCLTSYARAYSKLVFASGGTIPAHSSTAAYNTDILELTTDNVSKLNAGILAIGIYGAVRWSDETGRYETRMGQCYMNEPPHDSVMEFNFHNLSENQRERKLK